MKESIGSTQVHEVHLSKQEVINIVVENIKRRGPVSYDFDKENPIVLWDDGAIRLRYVQKKVTQEIEPRGFSLKPIPTTTETSAVKSKNTTRPLGDEEDEDES